MDFDQFSTSPISFRLGSPTIGHSVTQCMTQYNSVIPKKDLPQPVPPLFGGRGTQCMTQCNSVELRAGIAEC